MPTDGTVIVDATKGPMNHSSHLALRAGEIVQKSTQVKS